MPRNASSPVALVTGAAKRLGLAMATHLHQQGYNIIVHFGGSKEDALTQVATFNAMNLLPTEDVSIDVCFFDYQ